MAEGAARRVGHDENDLTRLGSQMLSLAKDSGVPGLRVIVFLNDQDGGTVAVAGYEEADVPGDLLADLVHHLAALGSAYGLTLSFMVGPQGMQN